MSARRGLMLGSLMCAALSVGCTSEGETSAADDAGSESDGGDTDANTSAGDAEACPTGGMGTLALEITIPAGIDADVLIDNDADQRVTASGELALPAGEHTLTLRRVTVAGDLVGRAFSAAPGTLETTTVCVKEGESTEAELAYALEPGSEHLWVLGGDGYHAAAYAADVLDASSAPDPDVTLAGGTTSPSSLAFDREGTLWIADATGKILGYRRETLGASQDSAPAIVLEGSTVCAAVVPCGPRAIAFDAANDMWLAMPRGVVRISADQLIASGEPEASSTLSGESVVDPQALAFDQQGALWIASGTNNTIVRFDAARLSSDDSAPADASFYGKTPSPVISDLGLPTALAFDADDNLWAGYFGPNIIARYTPAERETAGAVTPAVQLAIGVLALVEGMAFDDASNLWLTGKAGEVVRLAASALGSSDSDLSVGAVTLGVKGYAQDLALDPPAEGTPLAR